MYESLDLTKNCVGFSAPVAARAFAYLGIAQYESTVELDSNYISLNKQLQNYNRTTWQKKGEKVNFAIVANELDFELIKYLYRNMPPYNLDKIRKLYLSNKARYFTCINTKCKKTSLKYALNLAKEIIVWSKTDNADEGFNTNYPNTFIAKKCQGCWAKTVPGYLPALQPYWGNNRLMLQNNLESEITPLLFSTDTNAIIFKESKLLLNLYQNLPKEKEIIAEYWDDSPGISGTPTGHLYSIAIQLANNQQLTLQQTTQLFAILGIAINDAFINCWKWKYTYNLMRPITYIHRYVSSDFNTILNSPPFPEFPSGHSYQSGAGAEVFKYFFGDSLTFIDSTNFLRKDIIGTPKLFNSFTDMANEISISRFYGGIHFPTTLAISLQQGQKIGLQTINQLHFIK